MALFPQYLRDPLYGLSLEEYHLWQRVMAIREDEKRRAVANGAYEQKTEPPKGEESRRPRWMAFFEEGEELDPEAVPSPSTESARPSRAVNRVGRPSKHDWSEIVSIYLSEGRPAIKPFCRRLGIAPRLLRYHLGKISAANEDRTP